MTSTASDRPLILIVDDDPALADLVAIHVGSWGFSSQTVTDVQQMRKALARRLPSVILLDVLLGEVDGSELVAELKSSWPQVPVIMITRSTSVGAAVRAMKHGAADYITKPIDFPRLRGAIDSAIEVGSLARSSEVERFAQPPPELHGIVGRSAPMRQLFSQLKNLAPTNVSALILGETGTGKELVARAIHRSSPRRQGPFVAVNAAAIPHDLIESALFGHEPGAFTGARQARVGYCEKADGGTLFLDEIAEMGYDVQAKLLRFLQDHRVERVGGSTPKKVDVRVLAATNVDPLAEIERRRLREDLYYRLRVVSLMLPPLRQRRGDIELLARHFLHRASSRHGREMRSLSPEALAVFEAYPWPGNVRQLENLMEEAVVLHQGSELTEGMLPADLRQAPDAHGSPIPRSSPPPVSSSERPSVTPWSRREEIQQQRLEEALERTDYQAEEAARLLGISRATIYRRMKKYGLAGK